MNSTDHKTALLALLPLTAALDGEAPVNSTTLATTSERLNGTLPELFMALLKQYVSQERAGFIALFSDEGKGATAWNDTRACLRVDAVHGRLVRDLEEIVRSCTGSTVVNAIGLRVPGTPAEVVDYIAPAWLRVKHVLTTCLSERPDIAGLVRESAAA